MNRVIVFPACLISLVCFLDVTSGWVRFQFPASRRSFLKHSLRERLQHCGGNQESVCGVCGEGPREVRTSTIPIANFTVLDPLVIANHTLNIQLTFRHNLGGRIEFRLCNITENSDENAAQCRGSPPLLIGNGSETHFYPDEAQTTARIFLQLPVNKSCERCVIQAKFEPGSTTKVKNNIFFDCAPIRIGNPKIPEVMHSGEFYPLDYHVISGNTMVTQAIEIGQRNGLLDSGMNSHLPDASSAMRPRSRLREPGLVSVGLLGTTKRVLVQENNSSSFLSSNRGVKTKIFDSTMDRNRNNANIELTRTSENDRNLLSESNRKMMQSTTSTTTAVPLPSSKDVMNDSTMIDNTAVNNIAAFNFSINGTDYYYYYDDNVGNETNWNTNVSTFTESAWNETYDALNSTDLTLNESNWLNDTFYETIWNETASAEQAVTKDSTINNATYENTHANERNVLNGNGSLSSRITNNSKGNGSSNKNRDHANFGIIGYTNETVPAGETRNRDIIGRNETHENTIVNDGKRVNKNTRIGSTEITNRIPGHFGIFGYMNETVNQKATEDATSKWSDGTVKYDIKKTNNNSDFRQPYNVANESNFDISKQLQTSLRDQIVVDVPENIIPIPFKDNEVIYNQNQKLITVDVKSLENELNIKKGIGRRENDNSAVIRQSHYRVGNNKNQRTTGDQIEFNINSGITEMTKHNTSENGTSVIQDLPNRATNSNTHSNITATEQHETKNQNDFVYDKRNVTYIVNRDIDLIGGRVSQTSNFSTISVDGRKGINYVEQGMAAVSTTPTTKSGHKNILSKRMSVTVGFENDLPYSREMTSSSIIRNMSTTRYRGNTPSDKSTISNTSVDEQTHMRNTSVAETTSSTVDLTKGGSLHKVNSKIQASSSHSKTSRNGEMTHRTNRPGSGLRMRPASKVDVRFTRNRPRLTYLGRATGVIQNQTRETPNSTVNKIVPVVQVKPRTTPDSFFDIDLYQTTTAALPRRGETLQNRSAPKVSDPMIPGHDSTVGNNRMVGANSETTTGNTKIASGQTVNFFDDGSKVDNFGGIAIDKNVAIESFNDAILKNSQIMRSRNNTNKLTVFTRNQNMLRDGSFDITNHLLGPPDDSTKIRNESTVTTHIKNKAIMSKPMTTESMIGIDLHKNKSSDRILSNRKAIAGISKNVMTGRGHDNDGNIKASNMRENTTPSTIVYNNNQLTTVRMVHQKQTGDLNNINKTNRNITNRHNNSRNNINNNNRNTNNKHQLEYIVTTQRQETGQRDGQNINSLNESTNIATLNNNNSNMISNNKTHQLTAVETKWGNETDSYNGISVPNTTNIGSLVQWSISTLNNSLENMNGLPIPGMTLYKNKDIKSGSVSDKGNNYIYNPTTPLINSGIEQPTVAPSVLNASSTNNAARILFNKMPPRKDTGTITNVQTSNDNNGQTNIRRVATTKDGRDTNTIIRTNTRRIINVPKQNIPDKKSVKNEFKQQNSETLGLILNGNSGINRITKKDDLDNKRQMLAPENMPAVKVETNIKRVSEERHKVPEINTKDAAPTNDLSMWDINRRNNGNANTSMNVDSSWNEKKHKTARKDVNEQSLVVQNKGIAKDGRINSLAGDSNVEPIVLDNTKWKNDLVSNTTGVVLSNSITDLKPSNMGSKGTVQILKTLEALLIELKAREMRGEYSGDVFIRSLLPQSNVPFSEQAMAINTKAKERERSVPIFQVDKGLLAAPYHIRSGTAGNLSTNPVHREFVSNDVLREFAKKQSVIPTQPSTSEQRRPLAFDLAEQFRIIASGANRMDVISPTSKDAGLGSTIGILSGGIIPGVQNIRPDNRNTETVGVKQILQGQNQGKSNTIMLHNTSLKALETNNQQNVVNTGNVDFVNPFDLNPPVQKAPKSRNTAKVLNQLRNTFGGLQQEREFRLMGRKPNALPVFNDVIPREMELLSSVNVVRRNNERRFQESNKKDQQEKLSIAGKYFVGQLRRNDQGFFEPVPLAGNFESADTDSKGTVGNGKMASTDSSLITDRQTGRMHLDTISSKTGNDNSNILMFGEQLNNHIKYDTPVFYNQDQLLGNYLDQIDQLPGQSIGRDKFISQTELLKSIEQRYGIDLSSRGKLPADANEFSKMADKRGADMSFGVSDNRASRTLITDTGTTSTHSGPDLKSFTDKVRDFPNVNHSTGVDGVKVKCTGDQVLICEAVGLNQYIPGMVLWCFSHCKNGICPRNQCACKCEGIYLKQNDKSKLKKKKVIELTLNGSKEKTVTVDKFKTLSNQLTKENAHAEVKPMDINVNNVRTDSGETTSVTSGNGMEIIPENNGINLPGTFAAFSAVSSPSENIQLLTNEVAPTTGSALPLISTSTFEPSAIASHSFASSLDTIRFGPPSTSTDRNLPSIDSSKFGPANTLSAGFKCVGINAFSNTDGIEIWCSEVCEKNMCPKDICYCAK